MTSNSKIKFYHFLDGSFSLSDFESWIYSDLTLESEIGHDFYLELISFDFKDKNALKTVVRKIINIGDFEKWTITGKLIEFIEHPEKTIDLLNDFYQLFCGFPNDDPLQPKGYKFLQNLGLNYLYWIDEAYLKVNYGDKWFDYYKKYETEIPFYHKQLVPIANLILAGLESDEIEIFDKGEYSISEPLKEKLEGDKIFQLLHKD